MAKRTSVVLASCLAFCLLLAACGGDFYPIDRSDVATEPTVWATVKSPPDPILMGHWRRVPPGNFRKPDTYDYWLVKRGDRYAVYFLWRGHEIEQRYDGWAPFVIDGPELVSQADGSRFYVKEGRVWHNLNGRPLQSPMRKVDE